METEILAWDRKSVAVIRAIYDRHMGRTAFSAELVAALSDESLQVGASWLLKYHFEQGERLTQPQVDAVYAQLPIFAHWETKLHILQSMAYMPIGETISAEVYQFVQQCLTDKKKFVRAWAYNGLYLLAKQHGEYEAEARQKLDAAMRKESGSIKARARNIFKEWG